MVRKIVPVVFVCLAIYFSGCGHQTNPGGDPHDIADGSNNPGDASENSNSSENTLGLFENADPVPEKSLTNRPDKSDSSIPSEHAVFPINNTRTKVYTFHEEIPRPSLLKPTFAGLETDDLSETTIPRYDSESVNPVSSVQASRTRVCEEKNLESEKIQQEKDKTIDILQHDTGRITLEESSTGSVTGEFHKTVTVEITNDGLVSDEPLKKLNSEKKDNTLKELRPSKSVDDSFSTTEKVAWTAALLAPVLMVGMNFVSTLFDSPKVAPDWTAAQDSSSWVSHTFANPGGKYFIP